MDNIKHLKELIDRFVDDVECLNKAKYLYEIDELERKCVRELQAIEYVSSASVYRDLHDAVIKAKKEFADRQLNGESNADNSSKGDTSSKPRPTKRKTTKKA